MYNAITNIYISLKNCDIRWVLSSDLNLVFFPSFLGVRATARNTYCYCSVCFLLFLLRPIDCLRITINKSLIKTNHISWTTTDIFTIFATSWTFCIMWHFVYRHDPNLTSPSGRNRKLNFSKNHILWTTKDIFTIFTSSYRSIIILHFIHRHDPNLTSPSGRKRKFPIRVWTAFSWVYAESCMRHRVLKAYVVYRDNSTHTKLDPGDNWPSIICHLPVKCQLMHR